MDYIEVEEIIWLERSVRPFLGDDDDAYTEEEDVDVSEYEPFIQMVKHDDGSNTFRVLADSDTLRNILTTVCYDTREEGSNWSDYNTNILFVRKCDEVQFFDNNTKVEILQSYVAQDDEESYNINNIYGMSARELHEYIQYMTDDEINEIVRMHPDEVTSLYLKNKIELCRSPILDYYIAEMRENQIETYTRLSKRKAQLLDVEGAINTTVGALPGFHNRLLLEQIIRYQVFVSDDNQLREDIARRIG